MSILVNLITNIWKGVIGVIRISFLLLVFLVFALASGWIEIRCNPEKIHEDIQKRLSEIKIMISSQRGTEDEFRQNQIFQSQDNKSYYLILHRVQSGETLTDLSKIYGIHWQVIQRANGISDPRRLSPGQLIIIPVIKGYG